MKLIYVATSNDDFKIISVAFQKIFAKSNEELVITQIKERKELDSLKSFHTLVASGDEIIKSDSLLRLIKKSNNSFFWLVTKDYPLKRRNILLFNQITSLRAHIMIEQNKVQTNSSLANEKIDEDNTSLDQIDKRTKKYTDDSLLDKINKNILIQEDEEFSSNIDEQLGNCEFEDDTSYEDYMDYKDLPCDDHLDNTVEEEENEFEEKISDLLKSKRISNSILINSISKSQWQPNKTIGVWSPLHRMGVTTFIINWAIYLAANRKEVIVLEPLNNYPFLKTYLNRYSDTPQNWISYMEALNRNEHPQDTVRWIYRNVKWLPLGVKDNQFQINNEILSYFLERVKMHDVVLIDFPTGLLKQSSLDLLKQIDELWILVDDSYQHLCAWKEYIHKIRDEYNLKIKLIHNKNYSFSIQSVLQKELDIPLIVTIPELYEESHKNQMQNYPLLDVPSAYEKLELPFEDLAAIIYPEFKPKRLNRFIRQSKFLANTFLKSKNK